MDDAPLMEIELGTNHVYPLGLGYLTQDDITHCLDWIIWFVVVKFFQGSDVLTDTEVTIMDPISICTRFFSFTLILCNMEFL